jgi:integrase/recombinase XerD
MPVSENTKFLYSCAYTRFLEFLGKTWRPPKYDYVEKMPEFLPTEIELDQLIAGCGKRTAALLQLIKETGMRLGECLRLTWICINVEKQIITLTEAEKHSLPRIFEASPTLVGMLNSLPKQNNRVLGLMNKSSATTCLINQRKRIAQRLNNPRIAKIHYHLIRHWYATMLYHKTRDIYYVAKMLGHKHTMTTEIYINLEKMAFKTNCDEYTVKVATNTEEACQLLEVGFEYVTDIDGKKLFRKRK